MKGGGNYCLTLLPHASFARRWRQAGSTAATCLLVLLAGNLWSRKMNFILPPCSQSAVAVTSGCHFLHSCRPFGPQSFSGRLCAVKLDTLRLGRACFGGQCTCVRCEHGGQDASALIATASWFLLPPPHYLCGQHRRHRPSAGGADAPCCAWPRSSGRGAGHWV